jgi:hypothetical protein
MPRRSACRRGAVASRRSIVDHQLSDDDARADHGYPRCAATACSHRRELALRIDWRRDSVTRIDVVGVRQSGPRGRSETAAA